MNSDVIVVHLKAVITDMEQVREAADQAVRRMEEELRCLQDASHLGAVANFDFGLKSQAEAARDADEKILAACKAIRRRMKKLGKLESDSAARQSFQMRDAVDKT